MINIGDKRMDAIVHPRKNTFSKILSIVLLHMAGYNADIPVIFKTMSRDRCVIWMKANGAEGF